MNDFTAGGIIGLGLLSMVNGQEMYSLSHSCGYQENWEPVGGFLRTGSCVAATQYGCSTMGNVEICDKPRKEACDSGSQEWFCPNSPNYRWKVKSK